MKKKIIMIMLAFAMLISAGCSQQGTGSDEPTQSQSPVQTPAATPEPDGEDAAPEAVRPGILDAAQSLDSTGVLSYIPNGAIEQGLMQSLSFFGQELLSVSSVYDAEAGTDVLNIRLLSLDSGEILGEKAMNVPNSYAVQVQICREKIAVCDAQSGEIIILDRTLSQTESFKVSGESIYVSSDATAAYSIGADGVKRTELATGEERVILGDADSAQVCGVSGDYLSIRYVDLSSAGQMECYAGLDLATGTLEKLEVDDSFSGMAYSDGVWFGEISYDSGTYFVGTQQGQYSFETDMLYPVVSLAGEPTRLIFMTTNTDGSMGMSAYTTTGDFVSSFTLGGEEGMLCSDVYWHEGAGGYFLIAIDGSGHDRLYFWDVSATSQGSDLEMRPYSADDYSYGTALAQEYYDRARQLSEKYGVDIKIADQCDTEYDDKLAIRECDPARVEEGLETLERAMAAYPDGFFSQLYCGAYHRIEIDLMGELSEKYYIEGHYPTAFVQHSGGKVTMVININLGSEVVEQNFYHETSHIIDKVLEWDSLHRDGALYSETAWQELNPAEFIALNPAAGGYYDSYEIMPMEYYQESFSNYFAIDYGKSFATEDRATIFELAMTGNALRFRQAAPLYEKLEYYSLCIRDCFDTDGWPECTVWEAALAG